MLIGLTAFLGLLSGCGGFFEQYDVYTTGEHVSEKYALKTFEGRVCVLGAQVPTGGEGYRNTASRLLSGVLKEHACQATIIFEV